ncbi:MAG: DoxX family protein [Bdellovibrionaceae bacterium]|nr:DoxX family protein [Pseudobdellovibrionaceae bacterium]
MKILSSQNANPTLDSLAVAVLRVFVGLTMAFSHGLGKVPPPEQLIGGLESMGFPMPVFFAWCAGLAEFAGGLLLALGLLTRPSALFMAITMAVAAFVAHAADPFQKKEMALLYLFISLFFFIYGAGKWSLDAKLLKK